MAGRSSRGAVAAVVVTILSWASAFPLTGIAVRHIAPLPLASIRFVIAAFLVLLWVAAARPPVPSRSDMLRFALCGLVGVATYNILLNTGQQTVSAGAASFIVNTLPVFTALLAHLFLKERLARLGWAGMFVSLAGILLIASTQPGGLRFGAGATLVLGAAWCSAIYFVLQRPLIGRYGPGACAAYAMLAGMLLLLPWSGRGFSEAAAAPAAAQVALLLLAIFPAAIGYFSWAVVLGHFGAARAAAFLYLVPPTATFFAFAITGEQPRLMTVVGGAVAIAGVAIVNRFRTRPEAVARTNEAARSG